MSLFVSNNLGQLSSLSPINTGPTHASCRGPGRSLPLPPAIALGTWTGQHRGQSASAVCCWQQQRRRRPDEFRSLASPPPCGDLAPRDLGRPPRSRASCGAARRSTDWRRAERQPAGCHRSPPRKPRAPRGEAPTLWRWAEPPRRPEAGSRWELAAAVVAAVTRSRPVEMTGAPLVTALGAGGPAEGQLGARLRGDCVAGAE
mmetsp:Transcript_2314/g.5995  ORF Transcript_2314/g.5995 Transcript_2314/m.5995 type:complete len:202 (+) Transcript_2314:84-689(+)